MVKIHSMLSAHFLKCGDKTNQPVECIQVHFNERSIRSHIQQFKERVCSISGREDREALKPTHSQGKHRSEIARCLTELGQSPDELGIHTFFYSMEGKSLVAEDYKS
jgi:hypothetical protein